MEKFMFDLKFNLKLMKLVFFLHFDVLLRRKKKEIGGKNFWSILFYKEGYPLSTMQFKDMKMTLNNKKYGTVRNKNHLL